MTTSTPPYPAPSWGRWVKGSDGWMLHERRPGLYIQAKGKKKGKKGKGLKIKDSKAA